MKRFLAFFLLIVVLTALMGFSAFANDEADAMCKKAISMIKDLWRDEVFLPESDGYFEIAHTRVIYLKTSSLDEKTNEYLQEYFVNDEKSPMTAYVEFTLFTDYFASAPYYSDAYLRNCVAFYEDGTSMCLSKSPIEIFRSRTYTTNFDSIIERIEDMDGEYNEKCYLK